MSFERQADGTLLGCGPDRDYPGRAAAEEHWAKIRADIAAGRDVVERHPLPTLAEQADRQISQLERELAEWREIKLRATN